jgi:hypothetical protein
LIFKVGLDDPAVNPTKILKDCLYRCGNKGAYNYYITNAELLDKAENKHFLQEAIDNGKVYIDGYKASISTALQQFKEDIRIIL